MAPFVEFDLAVIIHSTKESVRLYGTPVSIGGKPPNMLTVRSGRQTVSCRGLAVPGARNTQEDFKLESERNYDLFCDNIYELMMSHKGNLFIDERGFSYINGHPYNCKHVYFELLTSEDVAEEKEDVIEYIDLALKRLSWHLETIKISIKDGYK